MLSRDDLGEILDALADMRDPEGREAGQLEDRLSQIVRDGDRIVEKRRKQREEANQDA